MSFTGDGDRIVSACCDGIVRIWDARFKTEAKEEIDGHSDWVCGFANSRDGTLVSSTSRDETVRLWNAHTGDEIGPPLEGHSGRVNCASFSPDGRRVVYGSSDEALRLWDAETHTQIGKSFDGVWCADGRRVVSGSGDQTVRIWNAATHEQIGDALLEHSVIIVCMSESSDRCHIVSRDANYNIITIIWKGENRAIMWKSKNIERPSQNDVTDEEKRSETDTTDMLDAFEN